MKNVVHALAVATSNAGKLAELKALFAVAELPITVHSLKELAPDLIVIEDGLTFASNATKKATALADVTSMLSLADDSGLEVDALKGAPGIFSARYAAMTSPPGVQANSNSSDSGNNAKLMADLAAFVQKGGAPGPWPARFRCALSLVEPFRAPQDREPIVVEATCEGHVIAEPRGEHGFGYDPLFVVSTNGQIGQAGQLGERTMAELSAAEKGVVSHRARAFQALIPRLAEVLAARNAVIEKLSR